MNQQTDRKYCLYGNVESSSCIMPFCREEWCYMCCLILLLTYPTKPNRQIKGTISGG